LIAVNFRGQDLLEQLDGRRVTSHVLLLGARTAHHSNAGAVTRASRDRGSDRRLVAGLGQGTLCRLDK